MDMRNRTRRKETPVRVVRPKLGLRLIAGVIGVLGSSAFCFMTWLALEQWIGGDRSGDVLTGVITMPLFGILNLSVVIYALRTQVRLYGDRLVVVELLSSKEEAYRDIARAGLFQDGSLSMLILEGKRTIKLTTLEYAVHDMETILEFVRDARRDPGYAKLEPFPKAEFERGRKNTMYLVIGGMAVALLMMAVFVYLE